MNRYHGDASTQGSRWEEWRERFELHITVNQITNDEVAKASFLLLMGREFLRIYRAKRKRTDNDSLAQMKAIMSEHFVAKRSVYTEVTARAVIRCQNATSINRFSFLNYIDIETHDNRFKSNNDANI